MDSNKEGQEKKRYHQIISKHIKQVEKQEERILNKKENTFFKSNIAPVMDKIQEKIPDKLEKILDAAFYKGFQLVFEKGSDYIEKTYDKNKIQLEYDLNDYAFDKYQSNKHVKNMDKHSLLSTTVNSSFAVIEGGVLGFLGIGLPDIPLFIAVIIRTINEISLSYGYQQDTVEEKNYLLTVISGALSKGDKQKELGQLIDQLGGQIDSNIVTDIKLEDKMRETADLLADSLLTAKFIQGIPIVGVIGGVVNHTVIHKIGTYAKVKYKKRYLLRKLQGEN
jgi:hypothetical protein